MADYLRSWFVNWDNYFSSAIGCSASYVSDVNRMLTPQLEHYISLLQRAATPPNDLDVNDTHVKRFFVSLRKALDILPNLLTKYPLYPDTGLEFIDIYYLCLHCFDLITLQLKDDPYIEIDFQRKKYYYCLRYWGVYNEVEVMAPGGLNKTLDGQAALTMNLEKRNRIGGVLNGEENEKEYKKDENVLDGDLVKEEKEFEKNEELCLDNMEDNFQGDKMVQGEGCDVMSIKADIENGKELKSEEQQIVQGHFLEDNEGGTIIRGLNESIGDFELKSFIHVKISGVKKTDHKEPQVIYDNGISISVNTYALKRMFVDMAAQSIMGREVARRVSPTDFTQIIINLILQNSWKSDPFIATEIKSGASADTAFRRFFVHDLAWNTTSETLCDAFREHDEIEEGVVVYGKVIRKSRGYGCITYKDMQSVQEAPRAPIKMIDGRMAICNLASEGLSNATITSDQSQMKLYVGGLSPETTILTLGSQRSKKALRMNDAYATVQFLEVQNMEDLKLFAKNQGAPGADDLNHWDVSFWSETLRESKYYFNEEELRPDLSLPKVMDGLFNLANKLFGVKAEPVNGLAPVWNSDVQFYRMNDSSSSPIAYFYFDPGGFIAMYVYNRNLSNREQQWYTYQASSTKERVKHGILAWNNSWDPGEFYSRHTTVSYLIQETCEDWKKILGANWESCHDVEFFMRHIPKYMDAIDLSVVKKDLNKLNLFTSYSIWIWDPGGASFIYFLSIEEKACIRGKECNIPKSVNRLVETRFIFLRANW